MELNRLLLVFLLNLLAFSCYISSSRAQQMNTTNPCRIANATSCASCVETARGSCFYCAASSSCEQLSDIVTNTCSVTEANVFFCELEFLYVIIIVCVVILLLCGASLTCCIICCVCCWKCRSSMKVNRDDREQLQLDTVNDRKAQRRADRHNKQEMLKEKYNL